MTIDELRKDAMFITLPERHKVFLVLYLESNGARTEAAFKAWNCKDENSANSMARRSLSRPDVRMLVAKFFGEVPEEVPFTHDELKGFIAKKIRTLTDENEDLRFKYVQIFMDMEGWKKKPTDVPKGDAPKNDGDEPFLI